MDKSLDPRGSKQQTWVDGSCVHHQNLTCYGIWGGNQKKNTIDILDKWDLWICWSPYLAMIVDWMANKSNNQLPWNDKLVIPFSQRQPTTSAENGLLGPISKSIQPPHQRQTIPPSLPVASSTSLAAGRSDRIGDDPFTLTVAIFPKRFARKCMNSWEHSTTDHVDI